MKGIIMLLNTLIATSSLTISSTSFTENGMIPVKYTCDGANLSPALHFQDLPKGAVSIAIIMHDPDAPKTGVFTHWIAWNINTTSDIPENFKGGEQGMNDAQKQGYLGPCPPSGIHHYHFKVYVLDAILTLDKNVNKTILEKAMKGHIIAKGELVGLYKKINTE